MGTVEALVAIVGGVVAAIAAAVGIWTQLRKRDGKPRVNADDGSVAAGRDMSGQVAIGDQSTVAGQAGVVMGAGSTYVRQGLDEESRARLVRMEALLNELKERSVAPRPGTAPAETDALVAQATARTEKLLGEAIALQRQHKEREAIERLLTAYNMDMPPAAKAQLHVLAGNGYSRLSNLEGAQTHYRLALAAAEEAGHQQGQAAAIYNLGTVYADRGELDKAEEQYKVALVIQEKIGDKLGQANALGNLGLVYFGRGDLEMAERYHRRAIVIDEEIGNKLGHANALGNLGNVYAERGELDKAEEHHKRAMALDEEIGNKLGQAQNLGNLGLVYADIGDMEKAEEHYRKARALFEEIGAELDVTKAQRLIDGLRP